MFEAQHDRRSVDQSTSPSALTGRLHCQKGGIGSALTGIKQHNRATGTEANLKLSAIDTETLLRGTYLHVLM